MTEALVRTSPAQKAGMAVGWLSMLPAATKAREERESLRASEEGMLDARPPEEQAAAWMWGEISEALLDGVRNHAATQSLALKLERDRHALRARE